MTKKDNTIPQVGLGTYGLNDDPGTEAVLAAMEIGYRHIDTAQTYNTEKPIGKAIDSCGIARDDLFVTTKITPENFGNLRTSLRESCDNLKVDHVDLTLIHWPAHYDKTPIKDYIGELARAQSDGMTRLIGVSNFTRKHLQDVDAELGKGALATNQFECHAYLQNRIIADYCDAQGIKVTAYMPIAGARLKDDPVLKSIAEPKGILTTQVALAYLLAKGYIVIPKSMKPERMKSNWEAAQVSLSAEEIQKIDALDRGLRVIDPEWGPNWD